MKLSKVLFLAAMVFIVAGSINAQTDMLGKIDTVYADIEQIDKLNWSVTVSYTNDETVVGLSIPFKLDAGKVKVVADSGIYTGGRVEHFAYKGFRADTAIQCVTLGMVANLGPTENVLEPGNGRLVTFFVSSLDKSTPVEKLAIDTTTTYPNNSLMTVAHHLQKMGDKVDTITPDRRKDAEIRPAIVIRHAQ